MNNICILGKVIEISKVKFDYYNKLKASIKIKVLDMDTNQIFVIIAKEKYCDYIIKKLKLYSYIIANCYAVSKNNKYYFYLKDLVL